jgi:hypothetical protein
MAGLESASSCGACGGCGRWLVVSWTNYSSSLAASVQTTERYLDCKQRFHQAVNDTFGVEDA